MRTSLVFLLAVPLWAQDPLSLRDAVRISLRENKAIAGTTAGARASEARAPAAVPAIALFSRREMRTASRIDKGSCDYTGMASRNSTVVRISMIWTALLSANMRAAAEGDMSPLEADCILGGGSYLWK